ncbi:hypothetical protein [Aestuariivita boseongensis]|uniref:hypothetical protein n=1 Tax=Aestuariivita boseongensis TaxID=1470562 RepID=UPI0012FB17C9|nr:hypothetical protein [Aestuariivita boseongensis]
MKEKELSRARGAIGARKRDFEQDDLVRALLLFYLAHSIARQAYKDKYDPSCAVQLSARKLIAIAQEFDSIYFPKSAKFRTLEQSVSRGRRELGIERGWTFTDAGKSFIESSNKITL